MKQCKKTISEKVQQLSQDLNRRSKKTDENVNCINEKVKKLEERVLPTVQEHIGDELDSLTSRINEIDGKLQNNQNHSHNSTNSFIIRNLPERERENIVNEVNCLLKDGLKIRDIKIDSAERKENRGNDGKPGVIVAKCKAREDKQTIMKCKSKLKDSRRYERVFIEHDVPKQQRVFNSNMRAIINTLGRDKLQLKGARVSVIRDTDNNEGLQTRQDRSYVDNRNRRYETDSRNYSNVAQSSGESIKTNAYDRRRHSSYRNRSETDNRRRTRFEPDNGNRYSRDRRH